MKLAIIGSRGIAEANIEAHLPEGVTEIVSGGAKGVDRLAAEYERANGIPLTEILPDYARYGRGAPLKRNEQIADYADAALVFWDGRSKGTAYAAECFRKRGKPTKTVSVLPAEHPFE